MRVLFRADSNKTVAMGHVMRCLSIADALKNAGHTVCFVTASDDPENLIKSRGFECFVLNTDFDNMDSEYMQSSDKEPSLLDRILDDYDPDIIVMDTYYLTNDYVNYVKSWAKTVYIDDYGKDAFPVDVLINYNIYGPEVNYAGIYADKNTDLPRLILGTDYVPMRREFINATPITVKGKGPFEAVLSTGGADSLRIAAKMAEKFITNPIEEVKLNILVGPFSKDIQYLESLEKEHGNLIKLWSNITDMPGFLSKFDMAMSAAGSTTYEICRMGVPAILYTTADNQYRINEAFAAKGIMESAGNAEESVEAVTDKLYSFMKKASEEYEFRRQASSREISAVSGNGAEKIVEKLVSFSR